MLVIKIIIIALIGAISAILLKQIKPEISILVIVATGILIILQVLDSASIIISTFENLSEITGINSELFKIILKIIGIGYLIEFSSSICTDSGLTSIATKIQFAGKVIILCISLPIINSLIEIITSILKLC